MHGEGKISRFRASRQVDVKNRMKERERKGESYPVGELLVQLIFDSISSRFGKVLRGHTDTVGQEAQDKHGQALGMERGCGEREEEEEAFVDAFFFLPSSRGQVVKDNTGEREAEVAFMPRRLSAFEACVRALLTTNISPWKKEGLVVDQKKHLLRKMKAREI